MADTQLITIYRPETQNLRLALDQPQNPIQTETEPRTRTQTQALVANHFHRMHVCCEKKPKNKNVIFDSIHPHLDCLLDCLLPGADDAPQQTGALRT
jgi:hypothetical protein